MNASSSSALTAGAVRHAPRGAQVAGQLLHPIVQGSELRELDYGNGGGA
ncbi:MAG: hypothetical protein BWY10_01638 [Chloroflexi bacterium ADurb.Bin180]|nr:MAG: hypothetical protein BWY10_01638 [Chloroflexi bacterium ADurb.Bin180]